ncbi:unnamed protein product, partial [Didymodactylos carnosus]
KRYPDESRSKQEMRSTIIHAHGVHVSSPCSSCTSTLSTASKNCRNYHHHNNNNDCATLITSLCPCHCRHGMNTLSPSSPHYNIIGSKTGGGQSNSNLTILMTTIAENGCNTVSSQRNKKQDRTTITTIDKTHQNYIDHSLSSDSQSNSDNNIQHEQNDINHGNEQRLTDK